MIINNSISDRIILTMDLCCSGVKLYGVDNLLEHYTLRPRRKT